MSFRKSSKANIYFTQSYLLNKIQIQIKFIIFIIYLWSRNVFENHVLIDINKIINHDSKMSHILNYTLSYNFIFY